MLVLFASLSIFGISSSWAVYFTGQPSLKNYTVCNEDSHFSKITLRCSRTQLIHIASVDASKKESCTTAAVAQCSLDVLEHFTIDCEKKQERCSLDLSQSLFLCSGINYVRVAFQCINQYDVHEMCPYDSYSKYVYGSAYYKTPNFGASSLGYNSDIRCECNLTTPNMYELIDLEVIYLDLRRDSTYCLDYISLESGRRVCSSPDKLGYTVKTTGYYQTSWKLTASNNRINRGGWLKVSLRSGNGYFITCSRKLTTTSTTTSTKYFRTTTPYKRWTSMSTPDSYVNVGGIVGGIAAAVSALTIVIFAVAVVLSQRSRRHAQRAGVSSGPSVSYLQQSTGYNGPASGSGEIPPVTPATSYGPPPSYSSLQLETYNSSAAGTSPLPSVATAPAPQV